MIIWDSILDFGIKSFCLGLQPLCGLSPNQAEMSFVSINQRYDL